MSKLIPIFETDISPHMKINRTPIALEASRRLLAKRKFKIEEHEQVLDLGEFLIQCHKLTKELEKRKNADYLNEDEE